MSDDGHCLIWQCKSRSCSESAQQKDGSGGGGRQLGWQQWQKEGSTVRWVSNGLLSTPTHLELVVVCLLTALCALVEAEVQLLLLLLQAMFPNLPFQLL